MWSFDAMKILVCGDGSILYFKDSEMREKADKWLYFGLEAKSGYENSVAQKWWEFDISAYGHRAIMNNVTAAMAIEQFKKLWYQFRAELQDNDSSGYSEAARQWAISSGLIQGGAPLPDGTPNYMWEDVPTREQLITVLYRFAQLMGKA